MFSIRVLNSSYQTKMAAVMQFFSSDQIVIDASRFYQMEEENLELRKKVAALTNNNDHLRKEVVTKEVRIIILEKNIKEMEGDRSCLLRQHIGTIVENNKVKESLEVNKSKVADLKKEISEKTKEVGELKESFKNEVQYKTTIADLENQIVTKNDKNEKLSRKLENTRENLNLIKEGN